MIIKPHIGMFGSVGRGQVLLGNLRKACQQKEACALSAEAKCIDFGLDKAQWTNTRMAPQIITDCGNFTLDFQATSK